MLRQAGHDQADAGTSAKFRWGNVRRGSGEAAAAV